MTKKELFNYLLTFLVLALSSISFFSYKQMTFAVMLIFSYILFLKKRKKFDKDFIIFIFILSFIIVSQVIQFSFFSLWTTIGTFTRFILPYFLIKIIGRDFDKYFVNLMYFFSIISFIFYFPALIFPQLITVYFSIANILKIDFANAPIYQNFIIFTAEHFISGFLRNSGFTWEPAAFAGFLNIAILLNTFINKTLINKKNIIFIIAIITTISTAGYITLAFWVIMYSFFFYKKKSKIIIIPIIVFIVSTAYIKLDFLGEKINYQMEIAEGNTTIERNRGRFGSGLVDFYDLLEHPVTGRGRNMQTRYKHLNSLSMIEKHRTNGTFDFMVKYGLLGFIIYFGMMLKTLKKLVKSNNFDKQFAYIGLISILLIGLSETWFQTTFFISLIYYYLLLGNNNANTNYLSK